MHDQPTADFVIGTTRWPGLAKLGEEAGELVQAILRLVAFPDGPHPDGTDTVQNFADELADVLGQARFVLEHCTELDTDAIEERADAKERRFREWHEQASRPPSLQRRMRAAMGGATMADFDLDGMYRAMRCRGTLVAPIDTGEIR